MSFYEVCDTYIVEKELASFNMVSFFLLFSLLILNISMCMYKLHVLIIETFFSFQDNDYGPVECPIEDGPNPGKKRRLDLAGNFAPDDCPVFTKGEYYEVEVEVEVEVEDDYAAGCDTEYFYGGDMQYHYRDIKDDTADNDADDVCDNEDVDYDDVERDDENDGDAVIASLLSTLNIKIEPASLNSTES